MQCIIYKDAQNLNRLPQSLRDSPLTPPVNYVDTPLKEGGSRDFVAEGAFGVKLKPPSAASRR